VKTLTLKCASCGATFFADNEYCEACGAPVAAARERDHMECDEGWLAAVSDRGLIRRRNEDAMAVMSAAAGIGAVVCDGVSTAVAPHLAADLAARAANAHFEHALVAPERFRAADELAQAFEAASAAVASLPREAHVERDEEQPDASPACTFVAAIWDGGQVTIGWAGDSRAYWIGDDVDEQVTSDHSWAQEQIDAGLMSEDEAFADRRAHAITRWLDGDVLGGPLAITAWAPTHSGRLVLCSDGLWNHLSEPAELRAVINGLPADAAPIEVARGLVRAALAAGGSDNVTVAVLDVAPAGGLFANITHADEEEL
jgi:serine/threonine protein phosphatase PrpC